MKELCEIYRGIIRKLYLDRTLRSKDVSMLLCGSCSKISESSTTCGGFFAPIQLWPIEGSLLLSKVASIFASYISLGFSSRNLISISCYTLSSDKWYAPLTHINRRRLEFMLLSKYKYCCCIYFWSGRACFCKLGSCLLGWWEVVLNDLDILRLMLRSLFSFS